MSTNTLFVSMSYLRKPTSIDIHFRGVSAEAKEIKDHVNPIIIYTLCGLRLTCRTDRECSIVLKDVCRSEPLMMAEHTSRL